MTGLNLSVEHSRGRQQRLLHVMQRHDLDLVVVSKNADVQWLTGCWFPWLFEPAAALRADGSCTLIAPEKRMPEQAAAKDVLPYEAQCTSTLRNDQRAVVTAVLTDHLLGGPKLRRVGVDFSSYVPPLGDAELVDVEPDLYYLRRRKDADELALMRKAIAGTEAMYAKAREIIEPGINELEVFSQLQAAAVAEFAEPLTAPAGNDYACAARGGPPRDRVCQDGELYILDLGPAYRGYFADNCRTIAVNSQPTDAQQKAWEAIAAVFPIVESTVKPGVSCQAFYHQIKQQMDDYLPGVFTHHLGHGVGLFPHEAPHLNPNWDDTFEAGDVFTVEPGLYTTELRAGIRLENNYVVTETGVEPLTEFALEL